MQSVGEHPHARRRGLLLFGGVLLLLAGGLVMGGEAGRFAAAGLQTAPFLLLAVLANLAQGRTLWRLATHFWLVGVLGGIVLYALFIALAAVRIAAGEPVSGMVGGRLVGLPEGGAARLIPLGVILVATLVLSFLALTPPVRRRVARVLPIDPTSFPHAVALSVLVAIVLTPYATLFVFGGEPPLLALVELELGGSDEGRVGGQLLDLVYGLIWMVPTAMVAAGFPTHRSLGQVLLRLGLVRPTLRHVGLALGATVLLLIVSALVNATITGLWTALGWPRTDTAAFEKLLGSAFSGPGALVVGVTAGLGEEIAVRGLLQPRVGWLFSNLVFNAAHAYQYGTDALLSVFILGAFLALVRARSNTTVSALVHGTYNTLGILATLALPHGNG